MSAESFLELNGLRVGYGGEAVLSDISMAIARGQFVALLGASGCGKTTLLRTIAGFIHPDAGVIRVEGRDITAAPPDRRDMALMFQSYALWPHMTVAQNIGYGLKLRRVPRPEAAARVAELAASLGLADLLQRKPGQLSGGQRQRVALGRALAVSPRILLLDEPLSNLDARIRVSVRQEIRALQQQLGITAIHVTHDREEAMVLADRIVILNAGRIAQVGTPEAVYNAPVSPFVAAFMGAENVLVLASEPAGDRIRIAPGPANEAAEVPRAGRDLTRGAIEARFRPHEARLHPAGAAVAPDALALHGQVLSVSYPGGQWRHMVRTGAADILVDASQAFAPGSAVTVEVPAPVLYLFNPAAPDPQTSRGATDRPVPNASA
ncbi:MAG: ATP-binding cassette domain-containing protein [Rhodobacteraceae bacterium]|nr:ATP-binding cassette domain-containing protein [Paracoccaceae bacterium]